MENENYFKEKELANMPKAVPLEHLDILKEKAKTCICKIECTDGGHGTGFFCNIINDWNIMKVLITNNHILNKEDLSLGKKLKFSINNDEIAYEREIDETRKIYTNEEYDITIIEIKQNDKLDKIDYFDIDKQIFKENSNELFRNMNIYLLHYPKGNRMQYSIGLIKNIDDYTIRHLCDSSGGSSGAPIINSMNFQVIGIHKGAAERGNYNLGTLLKEPLLKFNDKNGLEYIKYVELIEDPDNKRHLICRHCEKNCHIYCDCLNILFLKYPIFC